MELLYEYVSGNLDKTRKRDVEEYLPTCRDSQRELENLKKGIAYTESVASIRVSPALSQALAGFEPAWKKRLRAWSLWSSQRGWKTLPYVFLFMACTLGLYVTKPWQKESRHVILAEQKHTEPVVDGKLSSPQVAQATGMPALTGTPVPLVTNAVMAPPPQPVPQPMAQPAGEPVAALPPVPPVPPVQTAAASAEAGSQDLSNEFSLKAPSTRKAEEAKADDEKKDLGPGSGKGQILRGQLEVSGFDSAWPAIRDKIITLNGKAAGNVELGWLRRPNESYFHFSLPESNYEELRSFLKTFGPVRISKERHPRVMPEGQVRIILTVKDGGQNEAEAEAP